MRNILVLAAFGIFVTACSSEGQYQHQFPLKQSQRTLAIEALDASELRNSLESIRAWHETVGSGLNLNPPLSEAAFDREIRKFPCELPTELRELWRWHNGESTNYFVWYHGFLSVQESIDQYQHLTSEPLYRWSPNWIPVFKFQDEWYFVECADESVAATPVILYFTEDEPAYAYVNLTRYMKTMATAMERHVLVWSGDWWADSDTRELAKVHREFNEPANFPYALD